MSGVVGRRSALPAARLGVLFTLLAALLALTGMTSAAHAATCLRIHAGEQVSAGNHTCYVFAVLDRPEDVKASIVVASSHSYLVARIHSPDGKRVCDLYTSGGDRPSCDLTAPGMYRLSIGGSVPPTAWVAIQDVVHPRRCHDLGLVKTTVDWKENWRVPPACVSFRVGRHGAEAGWRGTRAWLSDGTRIHCAVLRSEHRYRCPVPQGRYTAVMNPEQNHPGGEQLVISELPPSACSSPERPSLHGSNRAQGTFVGANVDCYVTPTSEAGQELWVSVTTEGRQAPGRRIRRPDGTILCSTTSRSPVPCVTDVAGAHTIETYARPTPAARARQDYAISLEVLLSPTRGSYLGMPCRTITAPGSWGGRRQRTDEQVRCFYLNVTEAGQWLQRQSGSPDIVVIDPTGRKICELSSEDCTLPTAGGYRVLVNGLFGHWRFAVHRWTTPRPAGCGAEGSWPIAYGDAPLTQQWVGSEHDCVRFFGTQGRMVSAAIAWTGDGRPAKRIIATDGTEVCRSGAWSPLLCRIPATGAYYLESWRQPPLAGGLATPYRVSLQEYDFAPRRYGGPFVPNGCEYRGVSYWQPLATTRGRRGRVTDHVTCYELNNYFQDGLYRSYNVSVNPGPTRMTILDLAGRVVCRNAATTPCRRSGVTFLMVRGSAGNYSFSLDGSG